MSNPIILYDNRFEDGALTATNTAAGYDVNNIKDLRTHTQWKANAAGTLYITEAPLLKDTLAQEEMRISPADGYAGVYLPSSLDLTPYLGDRIVCLDSALKKHIGYIKSVGDTAVNLIDDAIAGMSIADDSDLDMGTNNFTPVRKVALPDWTPAAGVVLLRKQVLESTDGWTFGVHKDDGKLYVVLIRDSVATTYYSTAATGFTDGTKHTVGASITRETASAAGSIVFVADGVQLGTTVAITAADTRSLSNSSSVYVSGGESICYASANYDAALYNRALSVAEHLVYHQTGVAASDQYGSQTPVYTSDFSAGVDSWARGDTTNMTITGNVDSISGENDWLKVERINSTGRCDINRATGAFIANKRCAAYLTIYNDASSAVTHFNIGHGGGTFISAPIAVPAGTKVITPILYPSGAGAGSAMYIFPCDSNGTTVNVASGTIYYVKTIVAYEVGALLDLNESGIGDTEWEDSSTNGNDAAYPSSGCAVVRYNNIVSIPGGSTYNWESIAAGFDHADAAGYAYKISEPDTADTLGIEGHNLGTAGAAVSVESSDDESTWTERLAAFTPDDDKAILKTMTSFRAASKRLKIVTASVAPYLAVAMLGVRIDFNYSAYTGDGPIIPHQIGIVAESKRSKTGNLLGNTIRYKPIRISVTIPTDTYTWFDTYFWPFWRDHGSELKPFFYALDLTTFTDKIFWVKLTDDSVLASPMLFVDTVEKYTFTMEGVLEE